MVPNEIDTNFLKNFKKLITDLTKKGYRFVLVVGGGKTCRKYLEALKAVGEPTSNEMDWLGIHSTWLNAKLIQLMFGKLAHTKIISNPNKRVIFKEKILVAGGWEPGRSTDDDAVRLARQYGAKRIINLSNIDHVYNKDPRKFKSAKIIKNMTWLEFNSQFSGPWKPGANTPFDPTAAKLARDSKMEIIIANGKNLNNLRKILENKPSQGTVIK